MLDPRKYFQFDQEAAKAAIEATPLPMDRPSEARPLDPNIGERALLDCRARLLAVEASEVRAPSCDCTRTAVAALALVEHLEKPRVKQLFDLLPSALMGDATPALLRTLAEALLFLDTRTQTWEATQPTRRVDPALVARGIEVRDRMMRVLVYHQQAQPLLLLEVEAIKKGSGYGDLASDLARVAVHYSSHRELLSRDRIQYDAADEDLARGISHEIMLALSVREDRTVPDLRNRAFLLTTRVYTRLKQAGDFIYANDPTELAHFPALRKVVVPSSGRPKGSKKKTKVAAADEARAGEHPLPAPLPAPEG